MDRAIHEFASDMGKDSPKTVYLSTPRHFYGVRLTALTIQRSQKTVMLGLSQHPLATIFAIALMWIPGQARNDRNFSGSSER
jgi:hypothetical protein